MDSSNERASTGLKDIDSMMEGGFPKGSLVLLSGGAGSGKTTFALNFLKAGINNNEKVIYFSLAESKKLFQNNMARLGFEFGNLEDKFMFLESPSVTKDSIPNTVNLLIKRISEKKVTRLVIDSLTAISQALGNEYELRQFLHNTLTRVLRQMDVTTLMITEIPIGVQKLGGGAEEFIADGIIILETKYTPEGLFSGNLKIAKMRGTELNERNILYSFDRHSGIVTFKNNYSLFPDKTSKERVRTGVKGLDEMLDGKGLIKGSLNLVSGASGTGKTILSSQFINEGAARGERCLFISYEEVPSDIVRNAVELGFDKFTDNKGRAQTSNIGDTPKESEEFHPIIKSGSMGSNQFTAKHISRTTDSPMEKDGKTQSEYYPTILAVLVEKGEAPYEHIEHMANIIENIKPDRLVIDSLSALFKFLGNEHDSREFLKMTRKETKSLEITTICTDIIHELSMTSSATGSRVSSFFETLIVLKYVELMGTMKRAVTVLKCRGTAHDRDIREFEIETGHGIIVKGRFRDAERLRTRQFEDKEMRIMQGEQDALKTRREVFDAES